MSYITKLKFTEKIGTDVEMNPEDALRNKLITRLHGQEELAEAGLKEEQLTKTRYKFVTDSETGESKRVVAQKQLRRWWWTDEDGQVMLTLRYGNRPLAIADGKCTIEVGTLDKLPKVIETIIEAVKAGELDKQLNAAMAARRLKLKRVS
jgi:hypothetical protein